MVRPLAVVAGGAGTALVAYGVLRSTTRLRVEQPDYETLLRWGRAEVRRYAPRAVAVTEVVGEGPAARSEAFRRLLHYIQGSNSRSRRISMTSPVEIHSSEPIQMTAPVEYGVGSPLRMSFFMPSRYEVDDLPRPNDPRVRVERAPARFIAALRFRGRPTDLRVRQKMLELEATLKGSGWGPDGSPFVAQYDPPFVLPIFRRTEAMVGVRRAVSS